MAYFGKEFAFDKDDNFEAFISTLDLDEASAAKFLAYKPNQKITKDGDEYKLIFSTPNGENELSFKDGVTFVEKVGGENESKTTFTVDGDSITQVQDFGEKGTLTFKRDYSEDELKVTVTKSGWDGEAIRYYKAV